MTARDRKLMIWLMDLIDNELGVVEYRPTIRRLRASHAMLMRMIAADDQRIAKRRG